METLGERVKRIRETRGLTQQQLADQAGLGQSTINGIEKGSRQKQPASIIEIAHVLRVDAYWLKTGRGQQNPSSPALSDDERTLLAGFALMGEEMRQSWLETAQRTVEKAPATKKAIDALDAAKRKVA